nr:hypothetical protein [Gordonia otitidis]
MPPFADDELYEFYRRIEAGTRSGRRRRRSPARSAICPTPEKDAYRDVRAVDDAIARIRAAGRSAPTLRPYECVCGSWHLTSRAVEIPDPHRRRKRS